MNKLMLFTTLVFLSAALPVGAADAAKSPSKADREKMATAHEQMASCLRSDQEVMACHEALHKECQSVMGATCPAMEMGKGMHKGMKNKK